MTTDRIKDGVKIALTRLAAGDSVRKACDAAGISVTSLYHNSSTKQREKAYLNNTQPAQYPAPILNDNQDQPATRPIRRRKVGARSSPNVQNELAELRSYVAKLEHKLIQQIIEKE